MKPRLLLSLALSAFAANALALPGDDNQPLLGEARDSQQELRALAPDLAEGGADRLLERLRLAEDGADRTPGQKRLRLAEGGAERLLERRHGA